MNDHDSMFDDHSRWGSCDASLDEMPPQDFEIDYGDHNDFSLTGYLCSAAVFAIIVFIMFKLH